VANLHQRLKQNSIDAKTLNNDSYPKVCFYGECLNFVYFMNQSSIEWIAIFFTANKKANNKNKTQKSIKRFGFLQPQIDVK
jgi:hypothetical protein